MIATTVISILETAKGAANQGNSYVTQALVVVGWIVTALLAYWIGLRHRERDRRVEFYKIAVVNPSLPEISDFFNSHRQKLTELAKIDNADRTGLSVVKRVHLEFSENLRNLGNSICGRVETFDSEAVNEIAKTVDNLDDQITAWCFSTKQRYEGGAIQALKIAKQSLIMHVYKAKLDILK